MYQMSVLIVAMAASRKASPFFSSFLTNFKDIFNQMNYFLNLKIIFFFILRLKNLQRVLTNLEK